MIEKRDDQQHTETQKDLETSYSLENNGERESVGGAHAYAAPLYLSNGQNSDDILASLENLLCYTPEQIVTQKLILNLKTCGIIKNVKERCDDCGHIIERGPHRMNCHCRLCRKIECMKQRYSKAKKKMRSYLGKTQKVKEFYLSTPWIDRYTRDVKKKIEKAISKFILKQKKFNAQYNKRHQRKRRTDLAAIMTIDFKKKETKEAVMIRVHYHFVALPTDECNFNVNEWNAMLADVEKETGQSLHLGMGKYVPTRKALGYLANRIAGQYGHKKDGDFFVLQDFVSVEDYVKTFYRMRSYTKIGNRTLLKAFLRLELSSTLGLIHSEKCPKCGSKRLVWEFYDINDEEPPPPTCSECGLVVLEADFVKYDCLPHRHERGKVEVENVCRFCYEKSAVKKMKDLWSEFHEFISARESAEKIILHPTTKLTSAKESGV